MNVYRWIDKYINVNKTSLSNLEYFEVCWKYSFR